MHSIPRHGWSALALSLALISGQGCSSAPFADLWLFPDKPDQMPGIVTPDQRIGELQALAAEAKNLSPAEQEQVSTELARRIQSEEDPLLRTEIITTLASYSTPTSERVLQAGLSDSDADVRVACCEAWARRGGQQAVAELSRVLASDTNVDVRLAAARALGGTKDAAAFHPLIEAMVDADPAMQYRAIESLRSLSGRDFGTDVNAWREYASSGAGVDQTPVIAKRFRRLF